MIENKTWEHRKRVKMVLEYSNKYQTEVKGYDDILVKGSPLKLLERLMLLQNI